MSVEVTARTCRSVCLVPLQVAVLKSIKKSDLCDWVTTYMCPGGNFRQLTIQVSGHALRSTAEAPPSTEDAVRGYVRAHLASESAAVLGASPVRRQAVHAQPDAAAINSVYFTDYSSIDTFKSSSTILPVTHITE